MRKPAYQIAVVVINYKTPTLTIDCLESLLLELADLRAKVVVVDNASLDQSCEFIRRWLANHDRLHQVDLVEFPVNGGFSAGNNVGICHVEADYYLLLNSDTLVRPGAIALLIEAATKNERAGLIGPRLEWPDATPQISCFNSHSPISELINSAGTGLITRLLKRFNVPQQISERPAYYDWTSFACVLINAQVIQEIGLMDEDYFMYYEDVAFAQRARKAGWNVLNIPDAHVVHLRGGSSPVKSRAKLRKRLPRYYYESRTRYYYQFYGRLGLFAANVLWTLGWIVALFRRLISTQFEVPASQSQWRDIWINFYDPLKRYIHPDDYDKA